MFKKYLQFIFILVPIISFIVVSAYFAFNNWNFYQKNKIVKPQSQNIELLGALEHSMLNEIVCIATVGSHKNLMDRVCKQTRETTDSLMQDILEQKDDISLYSLEKIIDTIRKKINNNGAIAIDKLVKGELNQKINIFIEKYIDKLKKYNQNDLKKKNYVLLYSEISKIAYATESEKAFISYYLALKKAIPKKNLIFWNTSIKKSKIKNFSNENISQLYSKINDLYEEKSFQNVLKEISDVRLEIKHNHFSGNYRTNISEWINLLNKKQKVLHTVETILLSNIFNHTSKEMKLNFNILLASLVALLFGILGLLFLIMFWNDIRTKHSLLNGLLDKVSQINSNKRLELTENIASYKVACDYVASTYESLSKKEIHAREEIKTNKVFLNNIAYEICTPMNSVFGYIKLLKETKLDSEQSDFLTMMENNFENLESILSKVSKDQLHVIKRLEIENIEFDVVKNIESVVETFSIKADQKDIVLGLYINPTLSRNVKGDGTKLSQVITNLIDNALESSNAYDSIDIIVEKINDNNQTTNIKFEIKDYGLGYTENEVYQIKNMFKHIDSDVHIANIDMKNLKISNKIIKRMGSKLEFKSKKGEGSSFYFILTFEKVNNVNDILIYPTFEDLKIGLALPSYDIYRQVDKNLEDYVKYLKADFKIYDYESLFDKKEEIELPDIMFVYHNYARLEGELEKFITLSSKIALITFGTLRARINKEDYAFLSTIYAPITMNKLVKIFEKNQMDMSNNIERNYWHPLSHYEINKFEKLKILVFENNPISQKILTSILKKFNTDVTVVTNGNDIFKCVQDQEFNIIFMDTTTPSIDSLEIVSKILYYEGVNQLNHTPIIALSSDVKACDKYINGGMDGCMDKKIDEDKIYKIIYKHCIVNAEKLGHTEEDTLSAKMLPSDFIKE